METYRIVTNDELYHYGVEGMHWGVRRYQNPDGSLTAAGKKRYYKELRKTVTENEYRRQATEMRNAMDKEVGGDKGKSKRLYKELHGLRNEEMEMKNREKLDAATDPKTWTQKDKDKMATVIGLGVGGLAAAKAAGHEISAKTISSFAGNLGSTLAKGALATVGTTLVSSTLAGSVAFVIGSTVASSIIDKYGDVDIRDLPAAIRANRRNRWR